MDWIKLGQTLKKEREKRMLSQQKIADLVDLSVSHISQLESGTKKINIEALIKICKLFDVDLMSWI